METKYYVVKAKCGHVGKNNYIEIDFGVKAESKKDAARKARYFPRVKHHKKDAIIDVKGVSYEEFQQVVSNNNNEMYFKATSIQEQKQLFPEYVNKRVAEEKTINKKKKRNTLLNTLKYYATYMKECKKEYNEIKRILTCKKERIMQA